MLTPEFQAESRGFDGYSGFWRTSRRPRPTNIQVDPEALTVSYDVAYRTVNGGSTPAQCTLQLERRRQLLIAGEG